MNTRVLAISAMILIAAGCSRSPDSHPETTPDPSALARSSIIVDTHIDVPYRLTSKPDDISKTTDSGDFDYPRAVSGGLNAAFMSIYTPATLEAEGRSKEVAEQLISLVEDIVQQSPDKFATALSPADVRRNFDDGIMSLPLGMENGSPIEGDLENLRHFYERGIRYVTLAHSLSNHISDSSYDKNRQWGGLSPFGTEVISEMNALGMMIDVSHVSDDAFWQIIKLTKAPVIASHSSARHFTPGWERNMSDEMIIALAKQGGVIQINFGSGFISQAALQYHEARTIAGETYAADHPDLSVQDLYTTFPAIYAAEHGPMPYASVNDVIDHIDHVVAISSVNAVGIGSDFDGVGDSLPTGLKDVADYPNLIAGLLERGYSQEDVQKILGENLLRVWKAVEDYAATTSSST